MMIRKRDRKTRKREEAEARQQQRAEKTPMQQILALNTRLGKGKGAKKERKRLTEQHNTL